VLGTSATRKVTITNTGTAPATVNLAEQASASTAGGSAAAKARAEAAAGGAVAPIRIHGKFSPLRTGARSAAASPAAAPADAPWQVVTHYPVAVADNSAAYGDGTIYSVGGIDTSGTVTADGYAYDPGTQAWSQIAAMPQARQKPSVAYINGELIVTGGWDQTGATIPQTDIYDPGTNSWTAGRDAPAAYAGAGTAVMDNKMYVIGGCTDECGSQDVYVYDPATDQWSAAAPYPVPVAWEACGGLDGKVYCTGGLYQVDSYTATYAYDPGTNTWSQVASLPIDLWGSSYAAASGQLIVSGGITEYGQLLTNQTYAYDPAANTWTALASSTYPTFRGGSACGFYKIGGSDGAGPVDNAEQLPGYGQCGGAVNLGWVTETPVHKTLQPGASMTVTVSFDAGAAGITQPGTDTGTLAVEDDTPYDVPAVGLSMDVTPPRGWGQIRGIVTGVNCDGSTAPLAGADVQISTWAQQVSVTTDSAGRYSYWLDKRSNPVTLIVTDSTWQPQTKKVRISAGKTTTANFALPPTRTCH
jgi:N-acetylneuraminic acid mutarotase